ncbi:MAG: type II toxin-antitoxin system HicA family toxin [Candidatus Kapabacteria bacterium]|nr:type II toxin-antitoxin system HicA family toxin [Candidatus Kapabacteria bacterium]
MGRFADFSYREIVKKLKVLGFEFYRYAAGSHEIWYNPKSNRFTTVARHNVDMPEGTLKAILKQAGIDTDEFLKAK